MTHAPSHEPTPLLLGGELRGGASILDVADAATGAPAGRVWAAGTAEVEAAIAAAYAARGAAARTTLLERQRAEGVAPFRAVQPDARDRPVALLRGARDAPKGGPLHMTKFVFVTGGV